jgi:hypothetical protein
MAYNLAKLMCLITKYAFRSLKLGAFFGIFLIPVIIIGVAFYFLPTIVAFARHKKQSLAIFLVNFFLGWTFLGWVGALIWAVMKD